MCTALVKNDKDACISFESAGSSGVAMKETGKVEGGRKLTHKLLGGLDQQFTQDLLTCLQAVFKPMM